MVTISKNQNAEQAFNYYFQENNYQNNSNFGYLNGSGLKYLKLKKGRKLESKTYYFLLHGVNPLNKEKLVLNALSDARRAGIDVTMSPPKSFSILVEKLQANYKFKEAQELIDAHLSANHKTMKKIEENFLMTRHKNKKVKTDSFIYASFSHDLSRELDPQIHTHNFIFNLTFYIDEEDIKILSLSNEEIFIHKMFLGQFYRNELNKNLKNLGYETYVSDVKQGFFEIKGISKEQIYKFSSRTNIINRDIEEKLKCLKVNLPNANIYKLKESIKLKSRPLKNKIDRNKLRIINKERLENVGVTLELVLSLKKKYVKITVSENSIIQYINRAVNNLVEHKSTFSKFELSREIMKLSLKDSLIESDFLNKFIKCKNLIKIHDNLYSSHSIIDFDKYIIENIYQTTSKLDIDNKKVLFYCKNQSISLTKKQKNILDMISSSKRKFISIFSNKKTGKKFILHVLDDVYQYKYQFYFIYQKKDMSKSNSITIEQYLNDDMEQSSKQKIICIEDKEVINSTCLQNIIKFSKKNNDRFIFLIHENQIKKDEIKSNIFFQAQKFGIETIYSNKNLFTTKNTLDNDFEVFKERIELLEYKSCLRQLDKKASINEILDNHLEDTTLLTTKKDDYKELNKSIISYKNLDGKFYELLEQYEIEVDDKYNTNAYTIKSVLVLHQVPSFRKAERVALEAIVSEKTLIVKTRDNKLKSLDVSKYADNIEVFLPIRKMLYEHEKIVFTREIQDRKSKLRVAKGTVATVLKIEKNNITIELEHERIKTFNIKDVPFIDYAFALMEVNPNKRTSKTVIIADTDMSSLLLLFKQLKKIKNEIIIYVTNKKELKQNIQELHQEQIKSYILMPEKSVITNIKKDKNEHRDYAKIESDREKSNGFNDETNRIRKEHQWNIYDLGKHAERATKRIRDYILFRRDYKLAREYAKTLEWYQRAYLLCADKENMQEKETYPNVKDIQKEEEIESLQNEIFLM